MTGNANHITQAFRAEMDALVARRVPLAFALFFVLASVISGFELYYCPSRAQAVAATFAFYLLIGLVRLLMRTLVPTWLGPSTPVFSNILPTCVAGYFCVVHGSAEVLALMLALCVYGMASIYPWGWQRQALGTVAVPSAYIVALYAGAVPTQPPIYGIAAVLTATGLAILGAGLFESHRLAAYRHAINLNLANEQKNEFVGIVAHDLRNPLGAIQGYSEMLLDGLGEPLAAQHSELVERIHALSASMLHLVRDILDLSTIEAGKLNLYLQETALLPLVKDRLALHTRLAQQKHIALVLEDGEPARAARIDPERIGQVLDNLLTNAIKFSPPRTTVSLRLYQDEGLAVIAVRDQGPGIPARECAQLFQPFSRTSVASTAGEHSTGLGLAIVRKMVEGHQGRVWMHSEIGKGSTFYVALPTVAVPAG